jgi:hypothetical protein
VKKIGILFLLACNQGFGQFFNVKKLGKFSKKLIRLVEFIQGKKKNSTFLFEKIIVCNQGFVFQFSDVVSFASIPRGI